MTPHERRVLTITCFAHFMSHFNVLVFPALVLPLAGRLQMEMAQVVGLSFWMYLLYGLSALAWGFAADRWGALPFLALFYAGTCLSALGAAFWLDSPAGLTLCLSALGLFAGIYHPVGLGWISGEIRRISMGLAYNGMAGNLGIALAPLLAGLATWAWGPRAAFTLTAGLNLAGLGMLFLLNKDQPAKGANTAVRTEGGRAGAFVTLLVIMMLSGVIYRGSTVILPAYFELKNTEIFRWLSSAAGSGISANLVATSTASFIFVVGILGQYLGGRLAERFDLRLCYLCFHVLVAAAAFVLPGSANVPLVILTAVYFLFLLGTQPIENTLVAEYAPPAFRHSAYGTKFVLTFGVGALAVKLVAAIQDSFGIDKIFPCLGCISLVLIGVIALLTLQTRKSGTVQ